MCSTTVHHPTHSLGSIHGNTNNIVLILMGLLNGGTPFSGQSVYFNMSVGGLCARATLPLFGFICLILLLFAAIRLNVPLLVTVVARETRVVPFLPFA